MKPSKKCCGGPRAYGCDDTVRSDGTVDRTIAWVCEGCGLSGSETRHMRLATMVIEYRDAHGYEHTIDQLMWVDAG